MFKNSIDMVEIDYDNNFIIYPNCVLVKGYKRNAIYDLNGKVIFIGKDYDNELDYIFNKRIINIDDLQNQKNILDVCKVLENRNIGKWFKKNTAKLFQKCKFIWESPHLITNAIIDILVETKYSRIFISQLSEINCPFIQLRFYSQTDFDAFYKILDCINKYEIPSIQVLFPYINMKGYFQKLDEFLNQARVSEFIVYQVPETIKNQIKIESSNLRITTEKIVNENCCGKIGSQYFMPSFEFYSESLQFNTCLNRKISLTKTGIIKNCPSMKEEYGHINCVKIKDVLVDSNFQSWWYISKDEIEECKYCEYRHMCSDCRAYTIDQNNKFSRPLKCNYNPIKV